MEKETLYNEPVLTLKDHAIDLKIKAANARVIPATIGTAAVISLISVFLSPFDGFLGNVLLVVIVFINALFFMYQLLFHFFGKDLVIEAKKRGAYKADHFARYCNPSSDLDDKFTTTGTKYNYRSSDIDYNDSN